MDNNDDYLNELDKLLNENKLRIRSSKDFDLQFQTFKETLVQVVVDKINAKLKSQNINQEFKIDYSKYKTEDYQWKDRIQIYLTAQKTFLRIGEEEPSLQIVPSKSSGKILLRSYFKQEPLEQTEDFLNEITADIIGDFLVRILQEVYS